MSDSKLSQHSMDSILSRALDRGKSCKTYLKSKRQYRQKKELKNEKEELSFCCGCYKFLLTEIYAKVKNKKIIYDLI